MVDNVRSRTNIAISVVVKVGEPAEDWGGSGVEEDGLVVGALPIHFGDETGGPSRNTAMRSAAVGARANAGRRCWMPRLRACMACFARHSMQGSGPYSGSMQVVMMDLMPQVGHVKAGIAQPQLPMMLEAGVRAGGSTGGKA